MKYRPQEQVGLSLPRMPGVLRGGELGECHLDARIDRYVVAGAEPAAVGLQDDDFDAVVLRRIVQAMLDVGDHGRVLGVGLLGAVEDDARDRVFLLVDHGLELLALHGPWSTGSASPGTAATRGHPASASSRSMPTSRRRY